MFAELKYMASVLGLSAGEFLHIAREIAENGALRTVDDLTSGQCVRMLDFLILIETSSRKVYLCDVLAQHMRVC